MKESAHTESATLRSALSRSPTHKKKYIFICGRNINVYGSGNMCAHEKMVEYCGEARAEAFLAFEGLRTGVKYFFPSSIGGHRAKASI
jgi:hypothetical protein